MTTFTPKRMALSSAATIALAMAAPNAIADPVQFDIAEGTNLQAALAQFANQSDVEILYSSDIVNGKMAPALSGPYEPEAGLALLLAGSGLDFSESASGTLIIAQAETAQIPASTTNTGPSGTGEPVSVEGTVKGAITDSNLAGARVEIVETGQVTATDNLGRFRFPAVAPGSYTLRISYLGRETIQESIDLTSGDFSQSYSMGFPTTVGVTSRVDVIGTRSAREQALNQERTAQNAQTVINADQLGNFNGATISEALRRAPGIAFLQDGDTGEGSQIIARGLEPDFNQVTLNGVRLTDGTGFGRSPDLSNILTESIESVTISNTLLPSQDSNGAGALVEIETKSPLDRAARFANFSAEYGDVSGDFGDEFELGATLSGIFGSDQSFGASVSVGYRERERTSIVYSPGRLTFGQYRPADENGDPIRFVSPATVDPRRGFPFEAGANQVYPTDGVTYSDGTVISETLSVIGTLEKQFGGHTNLRLDVSQNERTEERYSSSVQVVTRTDFDLVDLPGIGERWHFFNEDPYRNASAFDSRAERNRTNLGDQLLGNVFRSAQFAPEDTTSTTTISFRGDTRFEAWDFEYGSGWSRTETDAGEFFDLRLGSSAEGDSGLFGTRLAPREFLLPQALNNTVDGRVVSAFAPLTPDSEAFIVPLFTEEGYAVYNVLDGQNVDRLETRSPRDNGAGETLNFNASARRNFESSMFPYIEFGLEWREDTFEAPGGPIFSGINRGRFDVVDEDGDFRGDFLPSELGLAFGPGSLTSVGAPSTFDALTRGSFESFIGSVDQLIENGVLIEELTPASANNRLDTSEEVLIGYVEGEFNWDKLQVIGGVRVEQIDVEATSFLAPDASFLSPTPDQIAEIEAIRASGSFVTRSASQTEWMPRVSANYRFDENLILRGSYFTTVSRPQIENLTQFQQVAYFEGLPRFGLPNTLRVRTGNPDLEPARTRNFDLRIERYGNNASVLKASAFYKIIENPLRTNFIQGALDLAPEDLELPPFPIFNENLPADVELDFQQPVNGDKDDKIWGYDLVVETPLDFLPDVFEGLGVYGNYTYTDGDISRVLFVGDFGPEPLIEIEIPFIGAPKHQGTAGLTYRNYGVDASLLYTEQSRRLRETNNYGLDVYDEAFSSLDLQLAYTREISGADVRFFLSGNDLLRDEEDAFIRSSVGGEDGAAKYFTGATYLGGRSFVFGASAAF